MGRGPAKMTSHRNPAIFCSLKSLEFLEHGFLHPEMKRTKIILEVRLARVTVGVVVVRVRGGLVVRGG